MALILRRCPRAEVSDPGFRREFEASRVLRGLGRSAECVVPRSGGRLVHSGSV